MLNFSILHQMVRELIDDALKNGWATGELPSATAEDVERVLKLALDSEGYSAVLNRKDGEEVSKLKPTAKEEASPNSISSKYGTDRQPLHVDGSHLPQPPELIFMWCLETSDTPTLLYIDPIRGMHDDATQGVFLVRPGGGNKDFLAPAIETSKLRIDSQCMIPLDSYSSRLLRVLENPDEDRLLRVAWDTPGKILAISNRKILHAREVVADGDENRVLYRMACSERRK